MFIVIGIMFAGMAIGYLFRRFEGLQHIRKSISCTILLLLFLLGIMVGSNRQIVDNIRTLGFQSFLFAVATTVGSLLAAKVVYSLFFRKKETKNEG